MKEKFNQSDYINEYNRTHYSEFKARLKKEEFEEINSLLKLRDLSKADFLRNAIDDYKQDVYKMKNDILNREYDLDKEKLELLDYWLTYFIKNELRSSLSDLESGYCGNGYLDDTDIDDSYPETHDMLSEKYGDDDDFWNNFVASRIEMGIFDIIVDELEKSGFESKFDEKRDKYIWKKKLTDNDE